MEQKINIKGGHGSEANFSANLNFSFDKDDLPKVVEQLGKKFPETHIYFKLNNFTDKCENLTCHVFLTKYIAFHENETFHKKDCSITISYERTYSKRNPDTTVFNSMEDVFKTLNMI